MAAVLEGGGDVRTLRAVDGALGLEQARRADRVKLLGQVGVKRRCVCHNNLSKPVVHNALKPISLEISVVQYIEQYPL